MAKDPGKAQANRGKRQRSGVRRTQAKSKDLKVAAKKRSRRPTVAEIEPLFCTYIDAPDQRPNPPGACVPKPEGAYFDAELAEQPIEWIEKLRHFKGKWAGNKFFLMAWQATLVREMFGWLNADGTRLYRLAYAESPRKSGKTSLAAAIALYLAHGDGEAAPEIFFAAFDKDQARIAYDAAKHMTEIDQELGLPDATAIYLSRNSMDLLENPGGFMKILSRESAKQFGLNMHGLIFDELMTQKDREMWNAVTTSQGSREQPLTFCISTAGWDITSVCFEQHARTEAIANGNSTDETFLGVVYGAPMDADWTDPDVWAAANPSLGETAGIDFYKRKCVEAQNQPTEQNAFRTLLLSQWVGQAERYIDMDIWDKNAAKVTAPSKRTAFGGLDLSTTIDMTAFVVAAEYKGKLDIYPHIFLPEAKLLERERHERAPYTVWRDEGLITLTPGEVVDYQFVKQAIYDAAEEFDLQEINYDRWNATQLVTELEDEAICEMVKVGQGFASMSSPTKELLRLLVEQKIRHGGHSVLRWCANAMSVATDPAGNVKPDKSQASQKIDPMVAMILAIDGWVRRGRELKPKSPYADADLAIA